jgi:O-antigen/teichoic acid export membrane protein
MLREDSIGSPDDSITGMNELGRDSEATSGRLALAWSLGVSVFAQAGTFATNVFLAQVLGKTVFGEWATVQSTIGTVSGIAQVSMSVVAMKFVAQYAQTRPDRVGSILGLCSVVTVGMGLLACIALYATAPWLATSVLNAPTLEVPIKLSLLTLLALTVNGYQIGALAGLGRFRMLALLGGAQGLATVLLVPTLALLAGLPGAVSGYAVALFLTWWMHHHFLRRELASVGIRVTYREIKREAGALVGFGLPATLSGVVGIASSWLTTVLLVTSRNGYAEMAVFAVALSLRGLVLFAPNVITRVTTPALTSLRGRRLGDAFRRSFWRSVALNGAAAASVALAVSLFSEVLLAFFGPDFRGSSAVVVIAVVGGVLEALGQALNQRFMSHDRMWANLALVIARSSVLVLATWWLVPGHGAFGAAVASLLAYLLAALMAYVIVRVAEKTPEGAVADDHI